MRRAQQIQLEAPRRAPRTVGRTFVITGAGSGLGQATARALARTGAQVVLMVRTPEERAKVKARVTDRAGSDRVEVYAADLSDPEALADAVEAIRERHDRIHGLIHSAGLLLPTREVGPGGTERMFDSELLGPYRLTAGLLGPLERGDPSRVVFVTQATTRRVPGSPRKLDLENLQGERRFRPLAHARHLALATTLLGRELGVRLRERGVGTVVVVPEATRTGYLRHSSLSTRLLSHLFLLGGWGQDPEAGARTVFNAALEPGLRKAAGQYLLGTQETVPPPPARDVAAARDLVSLLEELSGSPLISDEAESRHEG